MLKNSEVKARQVAARRMVAQKLETMAAECDDLAADLRAFPITSNHLAIAAVHLRKAVQCLVGPVDRTTLVAVRKRSPRKGVGADRRQV